MPSISKNVRILKRRVLQAYRVEVPKKQTFIKEVLKAIWLRRSHFFCPVPTASQSNTGMHGRGSQASAPASDAVTREGRRRPRVRAASCHVAIPESGQRGRNRCRRGRNRCRRGRNRADSVRIGRIGLYRPISAETAESGRNSKKKKKRCKTHRLT